MISFPIAKINLGLSILSKRPDGFHNLETIYYPLPVWDVLEIIPSEYSTFISTGLPVPGENSMNLVIRAYETIKKNYPRTGNLEIHLHKAIPMGAGLGGGSSDAAQTLLMINRIFKLQVSDERLMEFALELGSDCPFFMQGLPCFAYGKGEVMEPVRLNLSEYSFLLVHPDIHIDTAWAFSRIQAAPPEYDLKESILQPVQNWKKTIANAFEAPVFIEYPALKKIKDQLYAAGAHYAAMTGSGSTIFGIFDKSVLPSVSIENARQTFVR
jgi:4-diphosphocytidyl-2-C-methyl-D-erythritol kinase